MDTLRVLHSPSQPKWTMRGMRCVSFTARGMRCVSFTAEGWVHARVLHSLHSRGMRCGSFTAFHSLKTLNYWISLEKLSRASGKRCTKTG